MPLLQNAELEKGRDEANEAHVTLLQELKVEQSRAKDYKHAAEVSAREAEEARRRLDVRVRAVTLGLCGSFKSTFRVYRNGENATFSKLYIRAGVAGGSAPVLMMGENTAS